MAQAVRGVVVGRESEAERLLRELEDIARRNPLALVIGGLAFSMSGSRLLKLLGEQQQRSSSVAETTGAISPRSTGWRG